MTFEELTEMLKEKGQQQPPPADGGFRDYIKNEMAKAQSGVGKNKESTLSQVFKLVGSIAPVAIGALMGGGEGAAIGAGVASQGLTRDAARREEESTAADKYLRDRASGLENIYLKSGLDTENMAAQNAAKAATSKQSLLGQALLESAKSNAATERAKIMAQGALNRLEQRQQDTLGREQRAGVRGVKGQMLSTKQYKDAQQVKTAGGLLNELLAANKGGNQVSSSMIKTKMAKLAGEVGALTQQDVTRYATSPAVARSAADKWNQWTSGNFSDATADELRELVNVMTNKANSDLGRIEDEFVGQYSKTYDVDPERSRELFGLGNASNQKATVPEEETKVINGIEYRKVKGGWEEKGSR